jgi:hypothetical protein
MKVFLARFALQNSFLGVRQLAAALYLIDYQ